MDDNTSDIVERLRVLAAQMVKGRAGISAQWLIDAADEIERLRAALEPFAKASDALEAAALHNLGCGLNGLRQDGEIQVGGAEANVRVFIGDFVRAREAIG